MFERFTDRARRVLVMAQEEARLLGHDHIGSEHILLGLVHEGEGVAAKALESLGADLHDLRAKVEEKAGRGSNTQVGSPPFTPGAKKTLELSLREALQLGHNYIGTEHLLLALTRDDERTGAQALTAAGLDLQKVRQAVIRLMGGKRASDLAAVEGDRVETTDLPAGAGALLGPDEATALMSSWIDVRRDVSQLEVDGVTYESYTYRSVLPWPLITVAVLGAKVTKEAFDGYTRLVPDAEEVPGLGDAAAFSGRRRTLRVLTGETVIVVRVANHPKALEASIEVARRALANLAAAGEGTESP